MAKKFEDQTPAERQAAFDKWVEGRTARRAKSKVKRAAMEQLKKNHPEEYDTIVAQLEKRAPAPKGK